MWDNRKVIAHFGVIKMRLFGLTPCFLDAGQTRVVVLLLEHGDGLFDRVDVVFGQRLESVRG